MRAGRLFHEIKFYAKVNTRGDYGDSVDSYPTATVITRGEIREVGGNKTLYNEEKFYSKSKELTIRYNSAIVETMRIQIDNSDERYMISYIEVLGRNRGLRLSLEKINM